MVPTSRAILSGKHLLMVAVVVAATTLAGCNLAPPNPVGTPSPRSHSPNPTTTTTSPVLPASPTQHEVGRPPYQVLHLPTGAIRTLVLDEQLGKDFRIHRYAGWGPKVVFDSLSDEHQHDLYLADLEKGTVEVAASAVKPGWEIWEPDISGDWLVWTQFGYDHPTTFAGDLAFQLKARNLGSGTNLDLAAGVHTRLEGGGAVPPLIRVDGDQVVYAVEHTRNGHALGWRVTLQSLGTGKIERTFDTDLDLYNLDLLQGSILFTEGQADLEVSYKYGMRLMLSTANHPAPIEIARDAYDLAISGDRFTWESDPEGGRAQSPMPVRPVIMTATVTDPAPRQVSVTTKAPEPPPPGWGSPRFGGMFPATGDGLVAWQDWQTDGKTWDGQLERLGLWDSRTQLE